MVWMFSGIVFIAQIMCCVCFKGRVMKYLPTIIAMFFISTTVLRANMGTLEPQRLANQTVVCLVGLAAVAIYHTIKAVWNIMLRRRDPAQKLRK